jgi:hypothetical protein
MYNDDIENRLEEFIPINVIYSSSDEEEMYELV